MQANFNPLQSSAIFGAVANSEERLLTSSRVRPSVRMEQLGSQWTDFQEILCPSIFRITVEKTHVLLKSDKNKGHFTWRTNTFLITSRSFLLRMKNIPYENCRENRNTHFTFSNFFFFFENRTVYVITCKNAVERDSPQMTIWRMCIAYAGYLRLHTHTQNIVFHCNTGCNQCYNGTRLNYT